MAKSSYKDLRVWQLAMDLAEMVYEITDEFPKREIYGLAQQMRRAAVSIPSNIGEGYGRRTHRQTFAFLEQALGSLFELETQYELSARLRFTKPDQLAAANDRMQQIGRGIRGLMKYLETDPHAPGRPQ